MRLELGKKYRTHDGDNVGIVVGKRWPSWLWRLLGMPYTVCVEFMPGSWFKSIQFYTVDGIWHVNHPEMQCWDLIEEVP